MSTSLFIKTICVLFLLPPLASEKEFIKEYDESGTLIKEGWVKNDVKEGYWVYYFQDGSTQKKGHYHKDKKEGYWYFYSEEKALLKEGHFASGIKNGWWIFYERNKKVKMQYENGKREGFALEYTNHGLQKAIKYEGNQKKGEWTSLWSFRKDNPQVQF